ncbi:MAG: hypothetical protein IT216_13340 [Saprospiraceae bacterium]|nr:hypothetical protein [Saprospiraceae bacterium]
MDRFIFSCMLWMGSIVATAQSPALDLQKVLEPLKHEPYLYFENSYLYYENGKINPQETMDGVFHKYGNSEYIRMGVVEVLKIDNLVVNMDHENKLLSVSNMESSNDLQNMVDVHQLSDLLRTKQAKLEYIQNKNTWKGIQISNVSRPHDKVVIYYDAVSWQIKEVHITTPDTDAFYETGKTTLITVVIRYNNFSVAPKKFSYKTESFVRKEGGRYLPAGKCKGYRLI